MPPSFGLHYVQALRTAAGLTAAAVLVPLLVSLAIGLGRPPVAASILGIDRWRGGKWVVGVTLVAETNAVGRISVRVPFPGKG
jgi:hypothetical protein